MIMKAEEVALEKKVILKEIVKEVRKMKIIIVRCPIQAEMRSRIIQNNY